MNQLFVIFGAPDFEEQKAREICKNLGIATGTALFGDEPCNAANAYKANGFRVDEGSTLPERPEIILFECRPAAATDFALVHICDHHNPGDPGFGVEANMFWDGSSLGQLCNFLQVEPTPELLLVAAADHCPAAAYQGLCPGIDVEEFGKFRIERKLEYFQTQPEKFPQKQTAADLDRIILEAQQALKNAPEIGGFRDLRGAGYIDELPEAALRLGVAYMSETKDKTTGNRKIVCGGHTTPEMIVSFKEWAASQEGVLDVYGDHVRGFAGAEFQK